MNRRRWLLPLCALVCMAQGITAFADQRSQRPSNSDKDSSEIWEIGNFALFAAGLGWFVATRGPRFFAARSADIQKAIKEATGLKMDADLRYSEIDRKMASLAEAIKQMRDQSALEMQKVHQRMLRQTEQQSQGIRQSALIEIRAVEAEGRRRLKRYMAGLTLSLAYKRLQEQLRDGPGEDLLHEFVNLVEQTKN
jgi:F0F1-type ATP synthase membrane subunit b/b'